MPSPTSQKPMSLKVSDCQKLSYLWHGMAWKYESFSCANTNTETSESATPCKNVKSSLNLICPLLGKLSLMAAIVRILYMFCLFSAVHASLKLSFAGLELSVKWVKSSKCADYKLKKDGPSVAASLRTLFYALPRLLIVHLSRFTYTATGQSKVHKRVQFDTKLRCKSLSF